LGLVLIWIFFKAKNGSQDGKIIETGLSKPAAVFLSGLFIAGFIYSLVTIF